MKQILTVFFLGWLAMTSLANSFSSTPKNTLTSEINGCGHLCAMAYECQIFPSTVDVRFTSVIWDVSSLPATPFTFEWSNGTTTYGEFLTGGAYGSQMLVEDYTMPLTVTITDDEGCTWTEDAIAECGSTPPPSTPPTGLAYECVNDIATVTTIIWAESFADSTLTFTWSTGDITPAILINDLAATMLPDVTNGTYSVLIETAGGLSWTEEITVDCGGGVTPPNDCGHLPAYAYECTIFLTGVETTVTAILWDVASAPTTPYTFEWSTGDVTYSDFSSGILRSELVVFNLDEPLFVTVTDDEGCTWTDFIEVNYMFPGDSDLNGGVNHYDLLNIGLGFAKNGAGREQATNEWTPQNASTWNSQTPYTSINYLFADTNGDGEISQNDKIGIEMNWGQTLTPGLTVVNDRDLPQIANEAIPFYVEAVELTEGTSYSLPVMLGNSSIGVDGLYGVAFTVEYDPEVFDGENVGVNFENSWLGEMGVDLISIYKNHPEEGRIDIAISRTDGAPMSGEGTLCELEFIVIEDVIFMNNNTENFGTELNVSGAMLINEEEEKLTVLPLSTPIEINSVLSSLDETNDVAQISIIPNPVSEKAFVISDLAIQKIKLFSSTGEHVFELKDNSHQVPLSLGELPNGVYIIHIQTEAGVTVKKLQIHSK